MGRYPHNSLTSISICHVDEKAKLGDRWKRVRNRFVYMLRTIGFSRLHSEGDRNRNVYEKANVAVVVTREGIPSIRATDGLAPQVAQVDAIRDLWAQVKRATA